jgi:hypothetical protein
MLSWFFNPALLVSIVDIVAGVMGVAALSFGSRRREVSHRLAFIGLALLGIFIGLLSASVRVASMLVR